MGIPNDILLGLPGYWGLTGYLWAMVWLFCLVSVSHLALPLFASSNKDSHLFKKIPNHISFKYDWSYHVIWVGIIPLTILLIYVFHGKANDFIQDVLVKYKSKLVDFRWNKPYIPVISLMVTSGISFLIYKVDRISYIKAGMTTWWFPNPGGKPSLSTIFFHIWSAIIGSTALVYVIHHLIISKHVYHLLGNWDKADILGMDRTELITKFYLMVQYFRSPIYVLLPGVILGCINIGIRRANLNAKFADPVVIVTVILMTVGLFLLYFIPLLATGLASKIDFAKVIIADERVTRLTIFPSDILWSISSPVWSIIGTTIIGRAVRRRTVSRESQHLATFTG